MDFNSILNSLSKNEFPSQSLYNELKDKIDFNVDKDYLTFISKYNGAEGEIGDEQYLSLWDINNLLACNPYYEDVEECSTLFFIGTDGSNYGYAFDKITGNIVGIDFLDIGNANPKTIAKSFPAFLESLNGKEDE